jgi:hypothetical protein
VLVYIIVLSLVIIDFWVTKNITGRYEHYSLFKFRILVGLRWWNNIKEDGTEEWIFESSDQSIYLI